MSIVTDENMGEAMSVSVVELMDRRWMDEWMGKGWMDGLVGN